MLQTGSSGEHVESNVEDMIGFGIRHVKFENWTAAIDAECNAELPDHLLRDTNSASCDGLSLLCQFVTHGRTSEHRRLSVPVAFIDPFHRATLPSAELSSYTVVHLKTSVRADVA